MPLFFSFVAHAGYPLPPIPTERSFEWKQDLRARLEQKPRQITQLSAESFAHRGWKWDARNRRLSVLDAQGLIAQDVTLSSAGHTAGARRKVGPAEAATYWPASSERFPLGNGGAFVRKGAQQIAFHAEGRELWTVPLGFAPSEMQAVRQGLVGWSIFPPQLFYLGGDLRSYRRLQWLPGSELVSVSECAPGRPYLLENLDNGLSRLFFFDAKLEPTSYTLFDFSDKKRQSDVSAVLAIDCRDFIVAGPSGLSRVQY